MIRGEHNDYWAGVLEELFHTQIPITAHMGVEVAHYDRHNLELAAPLIPNENDKGTGFGGSLASLLTLAGWGLLQLNAMERDIECDIMIHKGEIEYLKPVHEDFTARCGLPEEGGLAEFFNRLQHRGHAKIVLRSEILAGDGCAVIFDGRYVAKLRNGERAP
jgi:thioesterase domain-containing protein